MRRDWSAIAHDVGNYILNRILTQQPGGREQLIEECHEYLRRCVFSKETWYKSSFSLLSPTTPLDSVGEDLRTPGKVPVEKFIIHKNLTKDPEAYPDKKSQPHVQVG